MSKFAPIVSIVLLVLVIFSFTKISVTSPFALQAGFFCLLATIVYGYILRRQNKSLISEKPFLYAVMGTILFLVGNTGWFLSPFFFTLYFLSVFLSFVFSTPVAFAFILTLVTIFSFHIGDVDVTYDFLVVLSLLSTIPLTAFLRKEYIRLKETEKEILVLRRNQSHYKDKIEEVLANKVNSFAVELRQPINDVKQMAYRLDNLRGKTAKITYEKRIIASSEQALTMLKKFEEETTGKILLITPKL